MSGALLKAEIEAFFKSKTVRTTASKESSRASSVGSSELASMERTRCLVSSSMTFANGAAILAKWLEAAIGQVISSLRFNNQ